MIAAVALCLLLALRSAAASDEPAKCSVDASTAFAECLQHNACGSHETAEEKCACYGRLARCYTDSLDVCVSQASFIEFKRACVRNAGCSVAECSEPSAGARLSAVGVTFVGLLAAALRL